MTTTELTPQPRPLIRPPANGRWNTVAFLLGAATYFVVMYRFQTYTERNNMPVGIFVLFSAMLFLEGFFLGIFAVPSPLKAASILIAGVFAAHAIIIAVDLREDPTNHNLLPFEFVYFFVLGSPAYLGAWLSRFARRSA
jgi:hypothetical protein